MGPTINAIHRITQPKDSKNLIINSAVRPDVAADLPGFAAKAISSSDQHTASLLEELQSILESIRAESPPGSEDIYGMDTSIFWASDDLQWVNRAPDGCNHGTSEVIPTEEEKAKFKRAVEIVKELTGKEESGQRK